MKKTNLRFSLRSPAWLAGCIYALGVLAVLPVAAADSGVDAEKLFKEGLYQRETGNLFTAIEAFQTVLSNQPSLSRARLELAVTYFRALNFEEAKKQAQAVLDDPKTPENVRLSILVFLAQIEQERGIMLAKTHVWEPTISLGMMYDSNVNAGPSSDLLSGGLVLTPGSAKRGDMAVVLQAGLGHTYNMPSPFRLGESAGRMTWQSRVNYYHRGYTTEHEFGLDVFSLSTGPAWFVPNKWRANVGLQVDDIYMGSDHLAIYTSLSPNVTWQFQNAELTWDAVYMDRRFKRSTDAGRDSQYLASGLSYGRVFAAGKIALQVGVRYFDEQADLARFSNDGTEFFAGANFIAWENGAVYGRVSQKDAKFVGVEPVFNLARDESENQMELGFNHEFKDGFLKDWKLNGSHLYTRNASNVSTYTYTREMTSLTLSRSF